VNRQGQGLYRGSLRERSASEGQFHFRRLGYVLRSSAAYFAAVFLCMASAQLPAQTAYFSGAISTIGNGYSLPGSVALDSSGNVYVADTFNSQIKEVLAAGGTIVTLGSGFNYPSGVAVDAAGNVFVADTQNNEIKEMLAVNGSIPAAPTIVVLGAAGGFSAPLRVAVDQNDNVYVADSGNNAIKEILASSGYAVVQTLGSGFIQPAGVAVDSKGNVYVADYGNSAVKEILAQGGYTTIVTLGSGFNAPDGVGVDLYGNVYVADTHNDAVKEMIAVNGNIPATPVIESLGSGFNLPTDVVADDSGHVVVSDRNNNAVKEIVTGGVNFGSVAIPGSTPTVKVLQFTFASSGTIQTPSVTSQGAAHTDFIDAGSGTCTSNGPAYIYNAGDSCNVSVAFQPQYSGTRYGAVQLLNSAGAVIATADVYGSGSGPQLIFTPPAQSAAGNSISASGVAVDGNGNLFVVDGHNITEILAAGGYTTTQVVPGSFDTPSGVAVDGSGNVYIADSGKGAVDEIVAASGYNTLLQLATGFSDPLGVAVDASGNVYVADTGNNAIREIVAVTGTIPSGAAIVTLGSGFQSPSGVAVDSLGNVFVADTGNSAIKEIAAVNGVIPAAPIITALGSGFNQPAGLALDGNDNIFVADTGNSAVREILASGGFSAMNNLGSAFVAPSAVAVDASGNVYVANTGKSQILKLDYADPPTLTFAATPVGSTSSDSPQTVTLTNKGNLNLTFAVPSSGNNPTISSSFVIDGTSTCPQLTPSSLSAILGPGASCTDLVNFTPATGGPITGELITTDNNLNFAGSTQDISLSGIGSTITIAPPSLASAQVGAAYTPAPLTASGGTSPYSFTVTGGALPPGITLSSAGVLSGTPTAAGTFSFTITATDANSSYGTQNYSLTVSSPTIVVTPAAGALPAAMIGAAYSTVTFGAAGGTSPYTWSETGTLPAGLTFDATAGTLSGMPTQAGTFSFSVTATDHSTGTGAPFSQTNAYTLTVNSPTIVITPAAGALPAATAGVAYTTVTFGATGGTSPYTWSENGTLPAGLTFNATAGTLSGTPTQAGTFSFSVTATDHSTGTGAPFSQTNAYTLAVNSPTITLSPAAGTLPAGTAYAAYSQTFTAGGGTGPYTFSEVGALPAGITLSSAGVLSGTPTAGGTFNFTVTATDSSTGTGSPFSQSGNYTLVINGPTITISPATLPAGNVGVPYSSALSASGGGTSYTYTEAGVLPAGLALSSAGALSGTPTAGGTFSFTVTAKDNNGFSSSPQSYTLTIGSAVITLLPANLPAGQVNTAYSQTFTAGGGTSPYTFSETGALPAGMTFSSAGVLSGTPTGGGTFNFTVTATDSSTGTGPYSASVAYGLTLAPGSATLNFAAIPPQTYGNSPFTVAASSSSTGAVTYSIISGPATIGGTTGLVTLTGAGMLTIGASQAATSSYAAATAQTTISVAQQASHVAVSASSNSITPGQSVTITANVTPAVFGAPTGTVTFFSGTLQLGSPVPLTGGMAQLALTTLPSGSDQISATYSGDANFLMSSGSLSGGITVAALGFTLTASRATQTGARGTTFAFLLTATPTYGMYPGTVTFSASGLPPGATATFSPSSLAVNAGPQNVGLAIATTTSTAAVHALPIGRGLAPVALAFLLLPLAGTRRMRREGRRFGRFLCLLLLAMAGAAATTALSGCGANTYQQSTTSQNYTVTITATSGTVQQSSTVTLTLH
jgi:sugar lactone lactonase YvrE